MARLYVLAVVFATGLIAVLAVAIGGGLGVLLMVALLGIFAAVAVYDLTQTQHAILRNYPVIGHMRFLLESIRPELQQYFIERNYDGTPFDRNTRSAVYQRAKNVKEEHPFGTERDLYGIGYEYLVHSAAPVRTMESPPRVRIGGPHCTQPYEMSLFNVSSMSYGSLSGNAIEAMNRGAAAGGFAHDTGEGGISPFHQHGGDLVWEIGSAYFGCRTPDGDFDAEEFARLARDPQVKMVHLKLSQGAKPGIGGVLPGAKVTDEIARTRGVPKGESVVSPAYHRAFSTPRELVRFIGRMRELADGKPTGFKFCVGSRVDILAIGKAMLEEQIAPDFITVDGAEGGTGAAPVEYSDHVGMPLTEGLITVHDALVGLGLRDQIRIGASGKVATGVDIVKRIIQGADYTNSARAMMMAVGCIQAQSCHTNKCPVGVTTLDPRRTRALHVPDKSQRVNDYHRNTVDQAVQIVASMGCSSFDELRPRMLRRRALHGEVVSYDDLCGHLETGVLISAPPDGWIEDWDRADPDRFHP